MHVVRTEPRSGEELLEPCTGLVGAPHLRRRVRARHGRDAEVESLVDEGREAFREERLDAALDAWRQALLIDPHNERIQAYIARAERQLENLERLRATDANGDEG